MFDATMARFVQREGYEARQHNSCAPFRTWVEEQADTPYDVKEACLAHSVDGAAARACQRRSGLNSGGLY